MINHTTAPCTAALSCPSCKKKLRVPDALKANAKVSCRRCKHVFRLGETSSTTVPPLVAARFAPEIDQPGEGLQTPTEPVRGRFRIKRAFLLPASVLVLAVAGGIARKSADVSTAVAGEGWEVGTTVLARWSADGFWYPAEILKLSGEQYEVRHLDDGTIDKVTADKLKAVTLKVGDHVSANRRRRGSYYDGEITYREGDKLRIAYNGIDIAEEDTTLGAVRVRDENTPFTPRGFLVRTAPRRPVHQGGYYEPPPSYAYQPNYSAPAYAPYNPTTPAFTPVAPSITPQPRYSNGMTQNEYGMNQAWWSGQAR